MKTSRRAVSLPFATTFRLVAGVIGGAIVLATSAAATLSLVMARRVVTPAQRTPDTRIEAIDLSAQTITLSRTPDTELPGRYGLSMLDSREYIKLGPVLATDDHTVTRKLLTQLNSLSRVDKEAVFSGWYYDSPDDLQIDYTPELIGTSVGPCPAWLFPGDDTWVIAIHGRGVVRAETLRAVPVFHDLGYTTLVVSYRNDTEAPRSSSGLYGLGSTEWNDVDAAIGYARRHGAKRVMLMGWSMGGAIAMQTVLNSVHASMIIGVILESPAIDWREVLEFQGGLNRVPAPISRLALAALNSTVTARLAGAETRIPFDDLDVLARADSLTSPVLILHSDDDGFVPATASRALAQKRPDIVTLESFAGARHTKLWNYDEVRWATMISQWAAAIVSRERDERAEQQYSTATATATERDGPLAATDTIAPDATIAEDDSVAAEDGNA